ncbi:hypothetical protein ACFSO0_14445 [Brevibacillus sp. GCM10020057]|uniref:TolB family protein n=1 Tax=Brevibacillus sp. GCM10020057 TaxID=3317327 RepID=UPI00362BCF82
MRKKWRAWVSGLCIAAMLTAGAETACAQEVTEQPARVNQAALPAKIACTNNQHLWLLDGRVAGAKPRQITKDGTAEIVGWSADGEWLLFLQYKGSDTTGTPGYLWAVRADGGSTFQVDERPVMEQPKWAPDAPRFAYLVNGGSTESPKPLFVIKEMKGNEAAVVQSAKEADFVDFSWMPDGKQVLVSTAAAKDRAMTLRVQDLAGKTAATYPIADPPNVEEGIYAWAARAMAVSADGRHVAYFLQYNSASLSADGVPIQLFDLGQPARKPLDLGTGLIHPQWLRWSPDGKQLAFIEGTDRMATSGKHLKLADTSGKVAADGTPDSVDGMPTWTEAAPYSLFFTRGTGTEYHYEPNKVMVPGQRIWKQPADAMALQVTQGNVQTADYFPSPSPDGSQLLFARLDRAVHGSLYLSAEGKETEVLRHVTGDIGYYASYLPPWVSVYWTGGTEAGKSSSGNGGIAKD